MEEGKSLTDKQKRFCEEYVIDWNGTRAAIAAGYSQKTAYSIANENLKKPELKAYIKEIQKDLSKLTGVTAARNIKELAKIAYSNISDLKQNWEEYKNWDDLTDEQKAAISEITHSKTEFEGGEKNTTKVKMHDKTKAIAMLNKMLGFEEPSEDQNKGFTGTMVLNVGFNQQPLPEDENDIEDFTENEPNDNDQ